MKYWCFCHSVSGEILTRVFLPVKSLQNLDQEWSSYLTDIAHFKKSGGFAYVKLRINIATKNTKIHKKLRLRFS